MLEKLGNQGVLDKYWLKSKEKGKKFPFLFFYLVKKYSIHILYFFKKIKKNSINSPKTLEKVNITGYNIKQEHKMLSIIIFKHVIKMLKNVIKM